LEPEIPVQHSGPAIWSGHFAEPDSVVGEEMMG
jgi:hypothetical protein